MRRLFQALYGWWNAVRPAWPSALIAAFALVLFAFTPQMIEVFRLEALRLQSGDPAQILQLAPAWFGLVLFGSTLFAVSLYALFARYSFTDRASPRSGLKLWTARIIGGAPSFGLLATYLVQTPEFGAPAWFGAGGLSTVCLLFLATRRRIERWMLEPSPQEVPGSLWLCAGAHRVLVALGALLVGVAATVMVLPMESASLLGPVGTAAVGFAVWSFLAALFVMGVNKLEAPPAALIVAAAVALFGFFNDNHAVRRLPGPPPPAPPSAAEHAALWVADRMARRPDEDRLAPMVVLAEGGGIRAAYFTATVLGELHETTGGRSTDDLIAISGVSGGGVGAASFLAAVADQAEGRTCDGLGVLGRVRRHLSRDLLSPGIIGLLFFDAPQKLLPVALLPDRAHMFERSLIEKQACEGESARLLGRPMEEMLARGTPGEATAPALLLSTARADSGALEVASNVSPTSPPNALARYEGSVSTATAAYLGARFPLIAPAGSLTVRDGRKLRYVDGGYNDMSGAVAARETAAALYEIDLALRSAAEAGCVRTPVFDALPVSDLAKARLLVALYRADGGCRTAVSVEPVVVNIVARLVTPPEAPNNNAGGVLLSPRRGADRPFEEVYTPVTALFAARHQRRWDAVELVCQYAAPEPRACAGMRAERTRRLAEDDPQELALRQAFFRRTRWINVFLDHGADPPRYAAVSYSGSIEHVPLGWYLGSLDGYVAERARAESRTALAVLRADTVNEASTGNRGGS